RSRAGDRLLRARRPGRAARALRGAGAARRQGRPRRHARRRGLPGGHGARHATDGRLRHGAGPAADGAHRAWHPGGDPVPAGEAAMNDVLAAVLPPLGVLLLFVVVIRALVGADRRERAARERIRDEIAAEQASTRPGPAAPATGADGTGGTGPGGAGADDEAAPPRSDGA